MIVVEGDVINNLYEAYLWLKEAWMYEPYNIYYDESGKKGSEYIDIEPTDDEDLSGWAICSLEEFKEFISKH